MGKGFYFISVGLLCLVSLARGCSDLHYGARAVDSGDVRDDDERKVFYSDVVAFGTPEGTVTGDYPYKDIAGVRTIKFKVLCTYKEANGSAVPETIYIAGIGNENGEIPGCPAAPIGENSKENVVMFLKRTNKPNVFEAEFSPNTGAIDVILDDLSLVCDLNLPVTADDVCQDFQPLTEMEECIRWTRKDLQRPTTTTLKPTTKLKSEPEPTPEPGKETEPETKPDDTVVDIDTEEDGKNNQSDQGYNTKTEKTPETGEVAGNTDNGSTIVAPTLLAALITTLLTLVVV